MKLLNQLLLIILLIGISVQFKFKKYSALKDEPAKIASLSQVFDKIKDGTTLENFLERFKYSHYNLSKGEAIEIFNFMDKSNKGIISENDAKDFVDLFIIPFEQCDSKKENFVEQADFEKCFTNEPTAKKIVFPEEYKDKYIEYLLDILTYNNFVKKINFYSYLLLRKAMFTWDRCSSDSSKLSANTFKCAINLASSNGYIHENSLDKIYNYLTKNLKNGLMNFLDYVDALTSLNIFGIFGARKDKFELTKKDFKSSALKGDRILNNFKEEEINFYYDLIGKDSMNFLTFHFFFSKYRLFYILSQNKNYLKLEEAVKAIDHYTFPKDLIPAIDNSYTNFKAEDYKHNFEEDSRLGEMKYYFSFKEKSRQAQPNADSRKVFFSIQCDSPGCTEINQLSFAKAFVFSSLYEKLMRNKKVLTTGYIIDNIDKIYEINIPTFGGNYKFGMEVLRKIPLDSEIDLILFNSIESLNFKIKDRYTIKDFDIESIVNEDYGMKEIPDKIFTEISNENSSESLIKQLVDIFTLQSKCAYDKRHPAPAAKK